MNAFKARALKELEARIDDEYARTQIARMEAEKRLFRREDGTLHIELTDGQVLVPGEDYQLRRLVQDITENAPANHRKRDTPERYEAAAALGKAMLRKGDTSDKVAARLGLL